MDGTWSDTRLSNCPRSRSGFSIIEWFVVVGIIAVLVALFLPAQQRARYGARLSQCKNNQKQIAMALHAYEAEYHCLPPAFTVGESGIPLHSWRTLILPYLDQGDLYKQIDLTKPWDDPINAGIAKKNLHIYHCPSVSCPAGHTTYVAIIAPNGIFRTGKPGTTTEVTDHHEDTLLVAEVDAKHSVPWMSPSDADLAIFQALGSAALPHAGGTTACFVDGHVHFLPSGISAAKRQALISISGGD